MLTGIFTSRDDRVSAFRSMKPQRNSGLIFVDRSAISRLCRIQFLHVVHTIVLSLIKQSKARVYMYNSVGKAFGAFWPGRDTEAGACQLRRWAGELRRVAGSRRAQAVPASDDSLF
jgi:hypothetical protein